MEYQNEKLAFKEVANFPKIFLDYTEGNKNLERLYTNFPDLKGFRKQIQAKDFTHRQVLVKCLEEQYSEIKNKPDFEVLNQPNTFTVTTGHQLNIFTGPLYVIYKIISTINLAKQLKTTFPEYNFVPIYWMATEDHDLEEISSFLLFGNKYTWETKQKGAVGQMETSGIQAIFEQLKEKPDLFYRAYTENTTLAGAVRQYMNELFGKHGLVCVDGNNPDLKRIFAPVMLEEIQKNPVKDLLEKNADELNELGYKPQINPRDINLFYMYKGLRERIEFDGEKFQILNTGLSFSKEEMVNMVEKNPEKISPNVALRPLYQETILPNLAYLGGPSELAYWLQLKGVFDYFKVAFPILLPRNLALVISNANQKKMQKLGISASELYLEDNALKKVFVEKNSKNSLSLAEQEKQIELAFGQLAKKAEGVDSTLVAAVEAEKSKVLKGLSNLEARLKKSEERKFETSIGQLMNLKEKLFPGGSQQERKENFLNYYLNDETFIEKLFAVFDPLDLRFNVVYL